MSIVAKRKTAIELPAKDVEDPETGSRFNIEPDDCGCCGSAHCMVLEMDSSCDCRIRCTKCGRATYYVEDERECDDCDDCKPHSHECDDHGHDMECSGCSCVGDSGSCECSCCLNESRFESVVSNWNRDKNIAEEGDKEVTRCVACSELWADCGCDTCDDCNEGPCSCDGDSCECDMHKKLAEKKNRAAPPRPFKESIKATVTEDSWENS